MIVDHFHQHGFHLNQHFFATNENMGTTTTTLTLLPVLHLRSALFESGSGVRGVAPDPPIMFIRVPAIIFAQVRPLVSGLDPVLVALFLRCL